MKFPRYALFGLLLAFIFSVEAREPTEVEQFYLELVNRARANPNNEVARLSGEIWGDTGSPVAPDLNEGLPAGTISAAAKQPLAFSETLIDSASSYSDFLLANEKFGHDENGSPGDRMAAAGYGAPGTFFNGENLGITTSTGPNPVDAAQAANHHMNLFIDGDVTNRGHRTNLMNTDWREVGIAIRADSDTESFFDPPFVSDVLSTQNFAFTDGRIFVTGVIYYDTNLNSFFDVGETAGVLDLEVRNASNVRVATGTSFGSGGYSINMSGLPAGTYTLIATDSAGDADNATFTWNNATNVKADIVDPAFTNPPIDPDPPSPGTITFPDVSVNTTLQKVFSNKIKKLKKKLKKVKSSGKISKAKKLKAKIKKFKKKLKAVS